MSHILLTDFLANSNDSNADLIRRTLQELKEKPSTISFVNGYLNSMKAIQELLLYRSATLDQLDKISELSENSSVDSLESLSTVSSPKAKESPQIVPPILFDLEKAKTLIQLDFSTWKLDHDHPDRKVYINTEKGTSKIYIRSEMIVEDGDIDILSQMHVNVELKNQWDTSFRNLKVTQTLSKKEDIIHKELKLPFPLSSRDFVLGRYYLDNEQHREEMERIGISTGMNKCKVIMMHPVEHENHPIKGSVQRADITSVLIFEEDVKDLKKIHITMISVTDLKGNVPIALLQKCVGGQVLKVFEQNVAAFRQNREKWSTCKETN